MNNLPGYEVPLHRSLTEPIMIGGVPRTVAILNLTVAMAFLLGMHIWYTIPLFIVIHLAFAAMAKKDAMFFECFRRHIHKKSYYSN